MKKIMLSIFMIVMLSGFVSAFQNSIVTGTVYAITEDGTVEVGGATVDVTCNDNTLSTTSATDANNLGDYFVSFYIDDCPVGSYVTVESQGASANGVMTATGIRGLNLTTVDVFVPEFTTIGAGLALVGAMGFFMYKRRK